MGVMQETPTEEDAAEDISGHLRVLWKKVDLMRRFPVRDVDDDACSDSDASNADSSEEAADDHAAVEETTDDAPTLVNENAVRIPVQARADRV